MGRQIDPQALDESSGSMFNTCQASRDATVESHIDQFIGCRALAGRKTRTAWQRYGSGKQLHPSTKPSAQGGCAHKNISILKVTTATMLEIWQILAPS
jgi:hypothetical protein